MVLRSRKIVDEFHRSCSLYFSAVMCVSQSPYFYKVVSGSRFCERLIRKCRTRLVYKLVTRSRDLKSQNVSDTPVAQSRKISHLVTIHHPSMGSSENVNLELLGYGCISEDCKMLLCWLWKLWCQDFQFWRATKIDQTDKTDNIGW